MLLEISCDKFRDKEIKFYNGINVICGDNVASNSIGKTMMLLIIDFVFGGTSYITLHKSSFKYIENHVFNFKFKFDNKILCFSRSTFDYNKVIMKTEKELIPLSLTDYKELLKNYYHFDNINSSFRNIISLYSRIWGKNNLECDKPLFNYNSNKESLIALLKLYRRDEEIDKLQAIIKKNMDEEKEIGIILGKKYINSNINIDDLKKDNNKIESELNNICFDLRDRMLNLNTIKDKEIRELYRTKDLLYKQRNEVSLNLKRIMHDLDYEFSKIKENISELKEFFPEVNEKKLFMINEFHTNIALYLKKYLKKNKEELNLDLDRINSQLSDINILINKIKKNDSTDGLLFNYLTKLIENRYENNEKMKFFSEKKDLHKNIQDYKKDLSKIMVQNLNEIANVLNNKINEFSQKVYGEQIISPIFKVASVDSYSYSSLDDKGTGRSYTNLLLFDLAVWYTSSLPILIHDSNLFKNIENHTVEKLIELYSNNSKQSFIALDEVDKYNQVTSNLIKNHTVLSLSKEKTLFGKTWNQQENQNG